MPIQHNATTTTLVRADISAPSDNRLLPSTALSKVAMSPLKPCEAS
jgi:hypothetical protein